MPSANPVAVRKAGPRPHDHEIAGCHHHTTGGMIWRWYGVHSAVWVPCGRHPEGPRTATECFARIIIIDREGMSGNFLAALVA